MSLQNSRYEKHGRYKQENDSAPHVPRVSMRQVVVPKALVALGRCQTAHLGGTIPSNGRLGPAHPLDGVATQTIERL